MQKRVPYAVADFERLITGDYYYVDKTRYIRELERFPAPVFLRSRRFGKSLWCSILECYYDVRFAERFETLFGSTDIGRNPTEGHNQFLVLRFDFSTVAVSPKYDVLEANFNSVVCGAVGVFARAHAAYGDFSAAAAEKSAANALRSVLEHRGDRQVYIVIDEYDNFTNTLITSNADALYTEVTTGDSFLRSFFKVIKAGVGEGSVANVFITGVLPVTMDDLTSGFNIAQYITFNPATLHMLGFTQSEVNAYVDALFADHSELDPALKSTVLADLKENYDGYHLLPGERESLYNSTVTNYYLSTLVIEGRPPVDKFDPNLNTDANWIKRLARGNENAKELVDQLLLGGGISASGTMLATTFNRQKLFDKVYFKVTLYYLGLVTFTSPVRVGIPNLTVRKLYTDYFNDLWDLTFASNAADDVFAAFVEGGFSWAGLFAGYCARYLAFLPAQAYDKVNENFVRSNFYLTFRERLEMFYTSAIEVNGPHGRCDFVAVGQPGGPEAHTAVVAEFKHYTQAAMKTAFGRTLDAAEIDALDAPPADAAEQVRGYAADLAAHRPDCHVLKFVVASFSTRGFRVWQVET